MIQILKLNIIKIKMVVTQLIITLKLSIPINIMLKLLPSIRQQ